MPLLLFLGHSPFHRWCRPSLFGKHKIEKRYVFLFSAHQVSAWGSCFRSFGLFSSWLEWWLPLVEVFGGVSWSSSSAGGFSPIQVPWVPVYLVSLALALSSCCLRHVQVACSSRCCFCSSHPSPAWFSSKTSASWVSTVSSAPDSEQVFTFGSFSLLGIHLRPRLLLP